MLRLHEAAAIRDAREVTVQTVSDRSSQRKDPTMNNSPALQSGQVGLGSTIVVAGSLVVLLWFGLVYLLCTIFWERGGPWF
jgi:hypothetical protein